LRNTNATTRNNAQPKNTQAEAEAEAEAEKKRKDKHLDFVFLSKIEHQKLVEKFGEARTAERIAALNDGIGSKGYKYKSHYHTILSWERLRKTKELPSREQRFDKIFKEIDSEKGRN